MNLLFTTTLLGLQLLPAWAAGSPHEILPRQATSSTMNTRSMMSSSSTQVPIATVCPAGVTASAQFEGHILAALPTDILNDISESVISIASATLPGGVTMTFSSLAKRADGLENANLDIVARLAVGKDGCQTLFAPTTTANCSTVVTPGAMPPVTVTDCDQYITFSSETLLSCPATSAFTPLTTGISPSTTRTLAPATSQPFPSMTASAMMSAGLIRLEGRGFTAAGDVPISLPHRMIDLNQNGAEEKRQLLMYPGLKIPVLTELVTVAPDPTGGLMPMSTPSFSFPPSITDVMPVDDQSLKARDTVETDSKADVNLGDSMDVSDELDAIRLAQLSPPSPTKYYAAPWDEITAGGVPAQVQAVICVGGLAPGETEDGDCTTYKEAWSVTTLTRTALRTSVASFDGPAVITYGSTARTTIIHFTQTVTTSVVQTYASVAHTTLATLGPTVTEVRTSPGYTQTFSLVSLPSISPARATASVSGSGKIAA